MIATNKTTTKDAKTRGAMAATADTAGGAGER